MIVVFPFSFRTVGGVAQHLCPDCMDMRQPSLTIAFCPDCMDTRQPSLTIAFCPDCMDMRQPSLTIAFWPDSAGSWMVIYPRDSTDTAHSHSLPWCLPSPEALQPISNGFDTLSLQDTLSSTPDASR